MEVNKQKEKNHYNKQAERIIKKKYLNYDWRSGSEKYGLILGIPFRFVEEKMKNLILDKKNKKEMVRFLDYGCGTGLHSILPAKLGAEVYGIDLSEKSLIIAQERAKREGLEKQIKFLVMDCEKLEFPNNFFDFVLNCGTLSCIDRDKGYNEIVRVLKPNGYFISIDTLGHNPVLNLNRKIKVRLGLRTLTTFNNILKMKDIEKARQYFNKTEVYFFNLVSLIGLPFLKLIRVKFIAKFLEWLDKFLLTIPFLQKYAFKVVFIFSEPKK